MNGDEIIEFFFKKNNFKLKKERLLFNKAESISFIKYCEKNNIFIYGIDIIIIHSDNSITGNHNDTISFNDDEPDELYNRCISFINTLITKSNMFAEFVL